MKILHTEASCGWGGQEIRILEESRGLIDRGHEVTLACPPHARIAHAARRYGVPVVPLPIEYRSIAGWRALRRHLTDNSYDVINTHSSADSWLVALACATMKSPPPIVRTRHISAPIPDNIASRWLYRQAKKIVTTGEALRRDLITRLSLDAERVISIPTGIDLARFTPAHSKAEIRKELGLDLHTQYIGIVATLRSWKGHLYLIEAMGVIDTPHLHLLIVGDGPMADTLRAKIKALGLDETVSLVGQVDNPETWLQAMDVFCLPSYANEGVPQALLQAMACGLPIITTPVGAIQEAVQDGVNALIVPPQNSAAIADALRRLVNDPLLSEQLGGQARTMVSAKFSKIEMLSAMERTFASAIDEE